jgi:hypothetical protein
VVGEVTKEEEGGKAEATPYALLRKLKVCVQLFFQPFCERFLGKINRLKAHKLVKIN